MTGEREDTDEVKQYTRLVGKALSQSILLYRPWIYGYLYITVYHDIHVYSIQYMCMYMQPTKHYLCMVGKTLTRLINHLYGALFYRDHYNIKHVNSQHMYNW